MIKKIYNKAKRLIISDVLFPENKQLIDLFGHRGKCYILGTSSTINELNLTALEENAMKISLGNFHEHPDIEKINPSIHLFAASHPPITETVLINWWERCHGLLHQNTAVLVSENDKAVAEKVFAGRKIYYYCYGGFIPIDFTKKIMSPWSVSVIAVQLAIYLKAKETYLLGIEHDWQNYRIYSHFYSHEKPSLEYYLEDEGIKVTKDNRRFSRPKEAMYRSFDLFQQHEQLKEYGENLKLKIYNGDPNSTFDVYVKNNLELY